MRNPVKAALAAVLLCVSLVGCASVNTTLNAKNPLTASGVFALRGTYDALFLTPATAYRKLPLCAAQQEPTFGNPCAKRTVVVKLQDLHRMTKERLDALEDFVKKYPGQLGAQGLYDAAKLAVDTATAYAASNKVGTY